MAPQAQLEESANDRGKPEVPFNRVLKRIPGPVLGTRFGGFCEWYLRFGCPKPGSGAAQDRPGSVCLFVCLMMFVHFFCSPFFEDFCEDFI